MKKYKINNKVIQLADMSGYVSVYNSELLMILSIRRTLEELLEALK